MTRKRALIIIIAAVLWCLFWQFVETAHARQAVAGDPIDLRKTYNTLNDEYFDSKLPKNTILDWKLDNPDAMAETLNYGDHFGITFNKDLCKAPRVAVLMEEHEMCHIEAHNEYVDHGPRWRTCMLRLDIMGAFRAQLIDGYNPIESGRGE